MSIARYDEIAEWYDEIIRNDTFPGSIALPGVFELLGDVRGRQLCDLACGQGVVARLLAKRGAKVVGIDTSAKLLEIAQRDESIEPLGIAYVQDDAQSLKTLADATFDSVLCNLALMDIPDIGATLRSVYRVLRPAGVFVFSIVHPCFFPAESRWMNEVDGTMSRVVHGYFEEIYWQSDNPNGVRGRVGAHHRTLSTYLNTLMEAGFVLERLLEPQATGQIATLLPGYKEIALSLVVKCGKA